VGERFVTELEANLGMEQDINRRDDSQAREARCAKPRAFFLIYDSHGPALDGVRNRRRLTVIEGFHSMTGNERFEVLPAGSAEGHNFNVTSINEFLQAIGLETPPLPARMEFTGNDVNRQNPVRHGSNDCWRAAGCKKVDDRTGIGDQWNERIS
jgi:hypothetical protein